MIYRYPRLKRYKPWRVGVFPIDRPDEGLTGFVQGQAAYSTEERFARALDKLGLEYVFQFYVEVATSIPEQGKEIDFMVYTPIPEPTEIDGDFAHKSAEQQHYDRLRDDMINEILVPYGYERVKRIPGDDVETQDAADMTAKELFG